MSARGPGIRVIAGSARGRRLVVPAGDAVRPTKDMVREAMFSALDARGRLVGAKVLDLYAGSGALAIESLSRGATQALLVERDRKAQDAIATNLETLGFNDQARLHRGEVGATVRGTLPREAPFDLVFLDPPYGSDSAVVAALLEALVVPGWLAPDALVSVEGPARRPPDPPEGVVIEWERAFGDTLVRFLKPL